MIKLLVESASYGPPSSAGSATSSSVVISTTSLAPPLPTSGGRTDNYIEHFDGQLNFSPFGRNSSFVFPPLLTTILSGLHNSTVYDESLIEITSPISWE